MPLMASHAVLTLRAPIAQMWCRALQHSTSPESLCLLWHRATRLVLRAGQVLQDRAETGSRHGRATFAVLLFQVTPSGQWRLAAQRWHGAPCCGACYGALVALACSARGVERPGLERRGI